MIHTHIKSQLYWSGDAAVRLEDTLHLSPVCSGISALTASRCKVSIVLNTFAAPAHALAHSYIEHFFPCFRKYFWYEHKLRTCIGLDQPLLCPAVCLACLAARSGLGWRTGFSVGFRSGFCGRCCWQMCRMPNTGSKTKTIRRTN